MSDTERRPASPFKAASSTGQAVSLADFHGKYLILYFFPKSFTPGCTRETVSFRDAAAEIRALGADIVGVSQDSVATQCSFAERYGATFPIIADADGSISRSYGVQRSLLPFSKRVTFIVDPDGYVVGRFHHEILVDKHIRDVVDFLKSKQS